MSDSSSPICTRCGAPIPAGAADQLCPACLMSGAVNSPIDETLSIPPRQLASSPESTEYPCDVGGYRLRGLLGRGGMGTVYDAEQIATGRRVALKMLAQQLDSPEMRQRFLREGRLAASVSHPNSLYIFGSEEIEGAPAITMEIAGSGTLKDKLKRRGPLPVTDAVDAILDVIAGLEAAFARGVLHRDIKPSNCFVNPDGSVKVGDFGLSVSTLAKDDSYLTATGVIMGTPAYAAPEQLRGDNLDVRADIYSVGATLFTLLTGRAPVDGDNVVQVVANAMNKKPKPLTELREDVPRGLERIVARCLAKEPGGRYADYTTLRNVLLPFSSNEPEPASIKIRTPAAWIDYIIAFLIPYVVLMLAVGSDEFHFWFLMDRTLYSARYYIAFLSFGLLYFSIVEGIWGAGLGKRLKGLRVVRAGGQLPGSERSPGIGRALIRILTQVVCIEGVRIPLLMASVSATTVEELTWTEVAIFSGACFLCPWIPVVLQTRVRREYGFATVWDLASRTRVVVKPEGMERPSIDRAAQSQTPAAGAASPGSRPISEELGPFQIIRNVVPGKWIIATDPVLRRQVWLLRQNSSPLSAARRSLVRTGRPRWLQTVETEEATWDVFEATPGVPLSSLVEDGKRVAWGSLRYWLHDVATELWSATGDQTLPAALSLDHVWVTAAGHAVVLDKPWPDTTSPAEQISVVDVAGQQRFLAAVAACVESTGLPLHAGPVLQNLAGGKFEKISFLTGNLRGLLNRPAEVSKGIRAGSIFMLPLFVLIMTFVGSLEAAPQWYDFESGNFMNLVMWILGIGAGIHLLQVPLRTTASQATFGLAVVNAQGERAGVAVLFMRWAIVWLPLLLSTLFVTQVLKPAQDVAFISLAVVLLLWISAAVYAVIHPNRGLHDRLAGTWVVRR